MPDTQDRPRVVIIGGGFGGLHAARALRRAPVGITVVDRRNHHLFQPLLYQVATGALSPANIAAPIRSVLRRQKNCRVLMATVRAFDLERRRVILEDGHLDFDALIVASGVRHGYFGHDEWEPYAPGLKTLEDATDIRRRILGAFEAAERELDATIRSALLTFVIVGAGPTGVELAGALSEVARSTLRDDFRAINPPDARIVLVEAGDRLLNAYDASLARHAQEKLARLGVEVRTKTRVTGVDANAVTLEAEVGTETLPARTVVWSAGIVASSLGAALAEAAGIETDRAGRPRVEPDLSIAGHPHVFVIGDLAAIAGTDGLQLPGVAPVAMQQGAYAARLAAARVTHAATGDGSSPAPFRYRDRGNMAVIGRYCAIAEIGRLKLSGLAGWMIWLFIHLREITQFQNRVLVFTQWGWNFLTHSRAARLITESGDEPRPPVDAGRPRERSH